MWCDHPVVIDCDCFSCTNGKDVETTYSGIDNLFCFVVLSWFSLVGWFGFLTGFFLLCLRVSLGAFCAVAIDRDAQSRLLAHCFDISPLQA